MNLLLLLSALLSALTGAGIGVRRPDVAQSITAQAIAAKPERAASATAAQRPVATLQTLAVSAAFPVSATAVLIGASDLWTGRRRE